ncbi:MAG: Ig-like domain-containing protein [Erysipelotrichaceae bacterium]|nr:Ig-like domain-containing protein [Erysipelotrichaceae bacterium]
MMKRFLNVFLSLLLLFTSVFVANNRIYAQEDDCVDEETFEVSDETSLEEEIPVEMSFEEEIEEVSVLEETDAEDTVFDEDEPDPAETIAEEVFDIEEEGDDGEGSSDLKGFDEDFNLSIGFDEDGNLIISCSDEQWLEAVNKAREYDENGDLVKEGGYLWVDDTDAYWSVGFGNSLYVYDGTQDNDYEIRADENGNKYLFVSKKVIQKRFLDCGYTNAEGKQFFIIFKASGYEDCDSREYDSIFSFPEAYLFDLSKIVEISQDETTHDLWVTSSEEQWLSELAAMNTDPDWNNWYYLHLENGIPFGHNYSYLTFYGNGEHLEGFYISYEALLAKHVRSGYHDISFPETDSYPSFSVELDFELDACKQAPEGLKVEETAKGIRFYFDDLDSEKEEYLNAMLQPSINDYSQGDNKRAEGSSINIYNNNGQRLYAQNQYTKYSSGTESIDNSKIILEDSSVYIPNDVVMASSLANSDDDYYIYLGVYGYSNTENLVLHGLRYARATISDDFEITVELDEDNNVIIRVNDPDFIEALGQHYVYENGMTTYYGSDIYIVNGSTNGSISFTNYYYPDNNYYSENYEIRSDETGSYVFISNSNLKKRFASYGDNGLAGVHYYFRFSAKGYEEFTTDPNKENEFIVFEEDFLKTVVLEYSENDNGDIIITCTNDDTYFRKMKGDFENNNFEIDKGDVVWVYDLSGKDDGLYINDEGQLILSHDFILSQGFSSGDHRMYFFVEGYLDYTLVISISNGCIPKPSEVEIRCDSDQNLIITVGEDYVNAFFENSRNYINFWNIEDQSGFSINHYNNSEVYGDGDDIVIKKEAFQAYNPSDGTYEIGFNTYGYEFFSKYYYLSGYVKTLEADVTAYTKDGNLYINCKDTTFLKALIDPREDSRDASGYYPDFNYGYIDIYCDDEYVTYLGNEIYTYNGSQSKTTMYTLSKTTITVKNNRLIYNNVYDTDDGMLVLHAPGYAEVRVPVEIKGTCSPNLPNDVEVKVEDNGDITITSTDTKWLESLVEKQDLSNMKRGGYISILDSRGWWHTFANYSNQTNYTYSDDKITVPADTLVLYGIKKGTVQIKLYGNKYKVLTYADSIELTAGVDEVPQGIAAKIDQNGDLVIYSELEGNEQYLENIARWTTYDKNDKRTSTGSYIYVYDESWNYISYFRNFSNSTFSEQKVIYDQEKQQAVVARENLNGLSGSNYILTLDIYGYEQLDLYVDFPLISESAATLIIGSSHQFTVNTDNKVTWKVSDEAIASVNENGLLSAFSIGELTLSAQIEGNEFVDSIPVSIVPPGNVSFSITPVKKDVTVGDTCQIVPKYDTSLGLKVTYSSSNSELATVDENGLVTFLNAGQVTISAKLYEGKSATCVFTIYPIQKGAKLAASIEGYVASAGIEALDSAKLIIKTGNEIISPEELTFSSAGNAIAMIDENGIVTALKPGTVKLTAKLNDDPQNRSVTFSLKVVARTVNSLQFEVKDDEHIVDEQVFDEESGILYITLSGKKAVKNSFMLLPFGEDKLGDLVTVEKVAYAPIDTSVLSVAADGTVTIKKAGQTAIKATVSSNPKGSDPISRQIIVRVVDYTPVLESAKITVNKYLYAGTDVKIHAIKGSSIESVSLKNAKTNEEDFITDYKDGVLNIRAKQDMAAKSYNEILSVKLVGEDEPYEFKYTVAVSVTKPKTTVKSSGTYNSALDDDSALSLAVTCAEAYTVEFVDSWASMDENGKVSLSSDRILKGKVRVYYEGYDRALYSESTITFKSVKTLPTASLSAFLPEWLVKNVLTMNKNFNPDFRLYINSSNEDYPISSVSFKEDYSNGDNGSKKGLNIAYESGMIHVWLDSDNVVEGSYKYTITPYIKVKDNDVALKNVTLTVKVSTALPKLTLSASSIKLNRNYPNEKATLTFNLANMPAGAAVNEFMVEGDDVLVFSPSIEDNSISFSLKKNGNEIPAKGTYNVSIVPVYSNAQRGTAINLKVSVYEAEAKASVSIKGSINQLDPSSETNCLGTIKLSNITANVSAVSTTSENVDVSLNEEGKIVFTLKKEGLKDQTLKNEPVSIALDTGDTLETTVSIKLARKAPTLKLSQTTLNAYDTSYQNIEVGRIALSELGFGQIADVWFSDSLVYDFEYDMTDHSIVVFLKDAANMKAGSTSNVTIIISYAGDYATYRQSLADKSIKGLKTTTLKLTIKDASTAVKAK